MKLPAIQFYPGDWHKDQGVQSLDLIQRGAWFELLLMMHDSDERGVLLVNGQPMPDAVIARRLGLDNQTTNQILTTLLTYGVASRRESDNALFCRRMVKDERLRQVRTEAGKKGGNPRLLNQTPNQKPTTGDKQIPTPSFSSSTSITSSTHTPPTPATEVCVLAEGSKKNEGPVEGEELPAEGSLASASHTGGAAAGVTTSVEFRPDPEWAPQMRLVAEQMAEYFGLSHLQQDARMRLTRFCRIQFEQGQGQLLTKQFADYRAYKKLKDERLHGWKTYIGTEAQRFADGAWNEKDWGTALTEARKLTTATGNGNVAANSLTSRNRYSTPARRDFSNDRRDNAGADRSAAAA
ncbi:hypothetical protein [Hymenobacter sp. UYP22]|uniref:hypothetical protein n=1 Tax=Hymenobacter sp. UYP22 TaxID=3156348 RepID=UPI0033923E96